MVDKLSPKGTFLKTLLLNTPFVLDGDIGKAKLSEQVTAKAELIYTSCVDHFNAIRITITNITSGPIDTRLYKFSEHLKPATVQSHPAAKSQSSIHVISYVDWKWYILQPSDESIAALQQRMSDYLVDYGYKPEQANDMESFVSNLTVTEQEALLTELVKQKRIAVHDAGAAETVDIDDVYDNSSIPRNANVATSTSGVLTILYINHDQRQEQ